jgi:hypothetical protein
MNMTLNWKEQGLHLGAKVNVTDRLLSKWDSRLYHLPDKLINLDVNENIVDIYWYDHPMNNILFLYFTLNPTSVYYVCICTSVLPHGLAGQLPGDA